MDERFGEWLVQFANENSVLGDLADDFLRDCKVQKIEPSAFRSAEEVRQRMNAQGACEEALEALSEAESLFR